MNLKNVREHNETLEQYRTRQKEMKVYLKARKNGQPFKIMPASNRKFKQRGARGLRTHHDPDLNYGSLSAHKKWAAIKANKPSKIERVATGMARLYKAFNIKT